MSLQMELLLVYLSQSSTFCQWSLVQTSSTTKTSNRLSIQSNNGQSLAQMQVYINQQTQMLEGLENQISKEFNRKQFRDEVEKVRKIQGLVKEEIEVLVKEETTRNREREQLIAVMKEKESELQ